LHALADLLPPTSPSSTAPGLCAASCWTCSAIRSSNAASSTCGEVPSPSEGSARTGSQFNAAAINALPLVHGITPRDSDAIPLGIYAVAVYE
jgi:hypothetical protein